MTDDVYIVKSDALEKAEYDLRCARENYSTYRCKVPESLWQWSCLCGVCRALSADLTRALKTATTLTFTFVESLSLIHVRPNVMTEPWNPDAYEPGCQWTVEEPNLEVILPVDVAWIHARRAAGVRVVILPDNFHKKRWSSEMEWTGAPLGEPTSSQ